MEKIICPQLRALRSVNFNMEQAKQMKALDLSAEKALDWVFDQIYSDHPFKLLDQKRMPFDVNGDDFEVRDVLDGIGGEDPKRTMLRYLDRSNGRHKNKLTKSLIPLAMAVHFALEIARRQAA